MSWKVRHEGSPQSVELPFEEVVQGILDGTWEPTDEVMGPDDTDWVVIESHPALEEIAGEVEPPPPGGFEDEAHLDMNALIEVCLVLLVFFILTTTVAALQKRLEAPTLEEGKPQVAVVTKEQIEAQMIHVTARMEDGRPVVRVEKDAVDPVQLLRTIQRYARAAKKTDLLLEHDNTVPVDLVVQIIDKAKGAGINRVRMLVP